MAEFNMAQVYLIEYGSLYSSEPLEPVGIFYNKNEAEEYIKNQIFSNLYHLTLIPVLEPIK